MNSWELVFLQSRANDGWYDEEALPSHIWAWPEGTWLKRRLRELRSEEKERDGWPIRGHSAAANAAPAGHDDGGNHFSLAPLLLAEADLPSEVRRALHEGRRRDAAALLKDRYGLDCAEAGELTDVAAC
ncbi:MAG TPA: hypothetical protein VGH50_01345 [Candidatus Binatia bacterium]|jgi:hypothetical protein